MIEALNTHFQSFATLGDPGRDTFMITPDSEVQMAHAMTLYRCTWQYSGDIFHMEFYFSR